MGTPLRGRTLRNTHRNMLVVFEKKLTHFFENNKRAFY